MESGTRPLIRQLVEGPPILACPDFQKPFTVQTDASDEGFGDALS